MALQLDLRTHEESLERLRDLQRKIRSGLIPGSEIDKQTIRFAEQYLKHVREVVVSNALRWELPHVTTEGEGEVSLEWWQNDKVLTLFIDSPEQVGYLKAWGPHIWREMEEGANPTDQELLNLWC